MTHPRALGIVDGEIVAPVDAGLSVLYRPDSVGLPKARAAADWVRAAAPGIEVAVGAILLSAGTAGVVDGYDIVIDSTGSAAVAAVLADAAARSGALLITGGVAELDAHFGWTAPSITADELEARLDRGADLTLLDVRERQEFDAGALPGAVLAAGLGSTSAVHPELDRGLPVVVYCARGPRALAAARLLDAEGFDVTLLERGVLGWILRSAALSGSGGSALDDSRRVPLPLGDIDQEAFRPNRSL